MRPRRWLLEMVVLVTLTVILGLAKPTDKKNSLLPASLRPEHYEISLSPSANLRMFQGMVEISGVAVAETRRVTLHCKGLLFNSTVLTDLTTQEEVGVEDFAEDTVLQQCHLLLSRSLQVDHDYRLRVEFIGFIGKDGVGLYRDSYKEGGVSHEMLMTHFQPNYARSMFPCFDEPHYKAQFILRVTKLNFTTLLSNTPVASVYRQDPEELWVEFEETPPMSTYLLVLVMCDYISLSDSVTNSSVWAPRSRLHEAQLALNYSVAVLEECERYFGIEHALPKLDHIPVTTLNTVAMENWGAITYKQDYLLWEEGVSTWAQRETVAYVICHEMVHQWLGNLVTTTWWNTTWLNEGVTTFFHNFFIDKIEPSWNVMDTMFVTQVQLIFNEEAMRDPKPLTNNEPFVSQDEIASVAFGASTYLKGAAILRMVSESMPADTFREAISQYIVDNEYETVDEGDLWQSLAAVADLPVNLEAAMYTWTHEPGYPLVSVVRGRDGCVSLTQEKYLSNDDVRWTIPVTYTTSLEKNFNETKPVWFLDKQRVMRLELCLQPREWILVNIRQTGFYRVRYDPVSWHALTTTLVSGDLSDIHPVNRGQLLHDGFDLALHGLLPFPWALDMTRYLRRETEYLPWYVAIQWFNVLKAHLSKTDTFPVFQRYVLSLVETVFSELSLRGDAGGMLPELHRKQIVEFACSLRHPACIKEATDVTYLLMSGVNVRVPLDLKPVLLCSAVRFGQDEVWHFVLKEYLAAADNDRWKYLSALACTSNRDTVERLLKDVANPSSFVKSNEERLSLLMEMGKQEDDLEPILDLILGRYTSLTANFDFDMILHLLRTFLTRLPTAREKEKLKEIEKLVNKMQSPKQMELMVSIVSDIDRLDFNTLYKETIKQWLEQEVKDDVNYLTVPAPPSGGKAATSTSPSQEPVESLELSDDEEFSGDSSENDYEDEDEEAPDPPTHVTNTSKAPPATLVVTNVVAVCSILLICIVR